MLYGGQIDRTCKQCRRNKAEKELSCGYLPESERSNMAHTIPTIPDIEMISRVCPVYTYLENVYMYQYLNIAKNIPSHQLSFLGRFVVQTYEYYQSTKKP